MRLLAIDTGSQQGSVALVDGSASLCKLEMRSTSGFGQLLFVTVDEILRQAGWKMEDIDAFAAATGPGSFTGLRIGLAAILGFSSACGKPAVGVSSLQALAELGTGELRACVLDARRDEVYAAVYGSALQIVEPEVVVSLPEWWRQLPEPKPGSLVTLESSVLPWSPQNLDVVHARQLAPAIGQIAHRLLESKQASELPAVEANYVRRSDAELKWTDRRLPHNGN